MNDPEEKKKPEEAEGLEGEVNYLAPQKEGERLKTWMTVEVESDVPEWQSRLEALVRRCLGGPPPDDDDG